MFQLGSIPKHKSITETSASRKRERWVWGDGAPEHYLEFTFTSPNVWPLRSSSPSPDPIPIHSLSCPPSFPLLKQDDRALPPPALTCRIYRHEYRWTYRRDGCKLSTITAFTYISPTYTSSFITHTRPNVKSTWVNAPVPTGHFPLPPSTRGRWWSCGWRSWSPSRHESCRNSLGIIGTQMGRGKGGNGSVMIWTGIVYILEWVDEECRWKAGKSVSDRDTTHCIICVFRHYLHAH